MNIHTLLTDNPHVRLHEANADYHADTNHVSHSMLKEFVASRPRYKQRFVTHVMEPTKSSDAMLIGSAVHCLVLEPADFSKRYRVIGGDRRTKAVKAAIAEAKEAGMEILKPEQADLVEWMADAVGENDNAQSLLVFPGIAECSIRWEDPETGIKCKCRPDWLFVDGDDNLHCIDIKTTKSLEGHFDRFERTAFAFGYDTQAAWYTAGIQEATGKIPGFGFIVVSKDAPPLCEVWELDDEMMSIAGRLLAGTMRELKKVMESGDWRNPREKRLNLLTVPKWRKENQ